MTKRFAERGIELEFGDDAVSQDFVDRAFAVARTRGGPWEARFAGECDVWGDKDGERVQLYRGCLRPRKIKDRRAKEAQES